MTENDLKMQKGIYWELAKGNLRALSHIEGCRRTISYNSDVNENWHNLNEAIENFIISIEDTGLQE